MITDQQLGSLVRLARGTSWMESIVETAFEEGYEAALEEHLRNTRLCHVRVSFTFGSHFSCEIGDNILEYVTARFGGWHNRPFEQAPLCITISNHYHNLEWFWVKDS